jgi:hypothetical protein
MYRDAEKIPSLVLTGGVAAAHGVSSDTSHIQKEMKH